MVDEFPNNSIRAKSDEPEDDVPGRKPKFQKVVAGKAVVQKKSLLGKFVETFVSGDIGNVRDYVLRDVIIPAIKDALTEAFTGGLERIFHGDDRPATRRRGPGHNRYNNTPYVPYNQASRRSPSQREDPRERSTPHRGRTRELEPILIENRHEADAVLEMMYAALEEFEEVTVLDYYDMVGFRTTFTDETWGWTDLRGTQPRRARGGGGYILTLPEPIQLN